MANTNYSYSTSLPAYHENPSEKQTQMLRIKELIQSGHRCLKQLEEATGLPQSTVAARVNGLIDAQMAEYKGEVVYKERKRKKIVLIQPEQDATPLELFKEERA